MKIKCNTCNQENKFQKDAQRPSGFRQPCVVCISYRRKLSKASKKSQPVVIPKPKKKPPVVRSKVTVSKIEVPVIDITPKLSLIDHLKGKNFRIQGNSESPFIYLVLSSPHRSIEGKDFDDLEDQLKQLPSYF